MSWRNAPPWEPVEAPLQGNPLRRDPAAYAAVLDQFEVQKNPRYARTQKDTFCNIFVWDATKAMGCEIPHWYDPATGLPTPMGKGSEQRVEHMAAWLDTHGDEAGWVRVVEATARIKAAAGKPVVALYRAPRGQIGHVAMVLPTGNIAQAGAVSLWGAPIVVGFGKLHVEFWSHE